MIQNKIIRFIYIGILNTIVYYLIYSILLYLGLNYKFAVIFATIFGVFFNFKTFGKYVFYNRDTTLLLNFIGIYLILFIVNIIFINIFNVIMNNYYSSGLIAIFPYSIVSYYLNNRFVFKKRSSK